MLPSFRATGTALLLAYSAPFTVAARPSHRVSFVPSSSAYQYFLTQNYLPHNLTNGFVFKTAADYPGTGDPTHGFVDYVDFATATANGLAQLVKGDAAQGAPFSAQNRRHEQLYLGVDHTTVLNLTSSANTTGPFGVSVSGAGGRRSLRLESRATFSRGLLVADLAHMPGNQCGVWPALWAYNFHEDPAGEIDILEGINHQATNMVSLHTGNDCVFTGSSEEKGLYHRDECAVVYGNVSTYGGCGVTAPTTDTYGTGFNAAGGGVYATLLEEQRLRVWHWARADVPLDLQQGRPDPSTWDRPLGDFNQANGGCDVSKNFHSLTVILNTDFCGVNESDGMWSNDPACAAYPSCEAFVASQPEAFSETYWLVNSIRVYEPAEVVVPVSPSDGTTTVVAPTTTAPPTGHSVPVNSTLPAPMYTNSTTAVPVTKAPPSPTTPVTTTVLTSATLPVPIYTNTTTSASTSTKAQAVPTTSTLSTNTTIPVYTNSTKSAPTTSTVPTAPTAPLVSTNFTLPVPIYTNSTTSASTTSKKSAVLTTSTASTIPLTQTMPVNTTIPVYTNSTTSQESTTVSSTIAETTRSTKTTIPIPVPTTNSTTAKTTKSSTRSSTETPVNPTSPRPTSQSTCPVPDIKLDIVDTAPDHKLAFWTHKFWKAYYDQSDHLNLEQFKFSLQRSIQGANTATSVLNTPTPLHLNNNIVIDALAFAVIIHQQDVGTNVTFDNSTILASVLAVAVNVSNKDND
ncbi:hypothetical protein SEUCBS140593_005726 [Sporothrix eucalyptigena]|uniref:GH16 domain-containing protein n=1 Tax=Sporothrix eucalyptigena TaxID=1812306 RepID=A0ABP0BYW3_9PEZI